MKTWEQGELLKYERELADKPLDIPGEVLEDVLIPARGFLRARLVLPGQVIRVIDVAGQQVADVLLYDPKNLKNLSSMTNTVVSAGTWKITVGHAIYSKTGQKMATIVADTVGVNVVIGGFCTPGINQIRYGLEGTHSCRSNLAASMADYGLNALDIEEGVFAPFMNMQYQADGSIAIDAPLSGPGDYLEMRAEMDVLLAMSNCPSEHNPCNGWNPTPLRVVIYEPTP